MFQWYLSMRAHLEPNALLFTRCLENQEEPDINLSNFGESCNDLLKYFDFIFEIPMIE